MKAETNSVIEMHYELEDDTGDVVGSSFDKAPIAILMGARNVPYGLEKALLGREPGDDFEVEVSPVDGYGVRRANLTGRYSKKHFARPKALRAGDRTIVRTPQGNRTVTVTKVGGKMVDVDLNHPLAGKTLRYRVEILSVRAADDAEIAHGHVHGPGGHGH